MVEIWQCDANGAYLHSGSDNGGKRDGNFQGFGRFLTGEHGRILLPHDQAGAVSRPHAAHPLQGAQGRQGPAHHAVLREGPPGNEKDVIWKGVRDEKLRDAITVDFAPIKGSKIGELAAKFDLVLGVTPEMD